MYSRTSLVTNNPFEPFQADSKTPFFYRECNCDTNLTSNTPANQYQRQKIIQNTVRVSSSLYSMNLAALNVYQKPSSVYSVIDVGGSNYIVSPGVNWNQMSDRKTPHLQPFATSSGSTYGCNCPDGSNNDSVIYNDPYTQPQPYNLGFSVGQIVYAKEGSNDYYSKATIITVINDNDYIVRFEDNVEEEKTMDELRLYFPCNCSSTEPVIVERVPSGSSIYGGECILLASSLLKDGNNF